MVLTKLWQLPKQETFNIEPPNEKQGRLFFTELKKQLEKDIIFLRSQKDLGKELFFTQLKISFGDLSSEINLKNKDTIENKNYLFLYIPGEAGFLIEPNLKIDTLYLYRATKVLQQLDSGNLESPRIPMFILKSGIIEEFKLLDENYVRVKENNKTLSVKQMSEMLLLLADSLE
ncbi:hypothetical protein [Silvanigrella sp.]|jgi:hypothetical protein|uniref:hypothetical protein n=1 Tax=Silvanigrella sp. TaxID=2024976 RepID=UPI0037C80853